MFGVAWSRPILSWTVFAAKPRLIFSKSRPAASVTPVYVLGENQDTPNSANYEEARETQESHSLPPNRQERWTSGYRR